MIISSQEVNDEDRNWKGFVANITNQINVINKEAKSKFDTTMELMRAKVDKSIKQTQEEMKQHVNQHLGGLGQHMD